MQIFVTPLVWIVRLYQKYFSPIFKPRCRYAPSCSQYMIDSINVHGIIKGSILGIWRLLRCNPFTKGGVDRVPQKGKWPSHPINYEEIMKERALEENSRDNKTKKFKNNHPDDENSCIFTEES